MQCQRRSAPLEEKVQRECMRLLEDDEVWDSHFDVRWNDSTMVKSEGQRGIISREVDPLKPFCESTARSPSSFCQLPFLPF